MPSLPCISILCILLSCFFQTPDNTADFPWENTIRLLHIYGRNLQLICTQELVGIFPSMKRVMDIELPCSNSRLYAQLLWV